MNLYTVLIRKDTFTLIPFTVTEHDVPILQELHGVDHVLNKDEKPVEIDGLGTPDGSCPDGGDEFARLCNCYGADVVQKIYGVRGTGLKKTSSRRKTAATE